MGTWQTSLRRVTAACAAACALAAFSQSRNPTPAAHRNPTSIILISVDTLRADHLSCYGYKSRVTTHIDKIAAGGTTFLQVNSQVPLTLPSHVSLLTSTYP